MVRDSPHPLALFSLRAFAGSVRAQRAIEHPSNSHSVSRLADGSLALDIGLHSRNASPATLAVLGRGHNVDIFLEGSGISRVQCSFEIDMATGIVMLLDRSFAQSTQVRGPRCMPFELGRLRQILVQKDLNTVVTIGGDQQDLFEFELQWHQDLAAAGKMLKAVEPLPFMRVENPRFSRTGGDAVPTGSSDVRTELPTPAESQFRMRYVLVPRGMLGAGTHATVQKAIDVDTGKLMAVKILKRPDHASRDTQAAWETVCSLRLETRSRDLIAGETYPQPHIIDFIASQGCEDTSFEIFMGLREGSLEAMIEHGVDPTAVAKPVLRHILEALDCLAIKGIIHRDVKPANILYLTMADGQYHFQLGDFGICNRVIDAATLIGTRIYMAPEVFQYKQTHKADVWALFVTMLWTLDVGGFRQKAAQFTTDDQVRETVVLAASSESSVSRIAEMAIVDVDRRASAAQMLVKIFDGKGLSTPREDI